MELTPAELSRRAINLDWLLFDVDGVLTDGLLLYGPNGEQWKTFDVRDGLGLRLAKEAGLRTGILTGRGNSALEVRAREIGFDALIQGRHDKDAAFTEFLLEHRALPERVAYMGDDILDLPVLRRVGLAFAPADAMPDVRERVHHVVSRPGGRGAVREMCEVILHARGHWDALVSHLLAGW